MKIPSRIWRPDEAFMRASQLSWRCRVSLIAIIALWTSAACAPAAQARVETKIVGETSLQALADGFLVPGPPGQVRVLVSPCPGDYSAQGCHSPGRMMDTIWLNPATGGLDAETFAHEMGHVFESYMWDLRWQRGARFVPQLFRRMVPLLDLKPSSGVLSSTEWTERFAEAYSLCAREGVLSGPVSTGYWGFETTPERHAATCSLITTLATGYRRVLGRGRHRSTTPV
jgi:hypothetical protein